MHRLTPTHALGACTQLTLLFNAHVFKKMLPNACV